MSSTNQFNKQLAIIRYLFASIVLRSVFIVAENNRTDTISITSITNVSNALYKIKYNDSNSNNNLFNIHIDMKVYATFNIGILSDPTMSIEIMKIA